MHVAFVAKSLSYAVCKIKKANHVQQFLAAPLHSFRNGMKYFETSGMHTMKKMMYLLLSICLALQLTACGGGNGGGGNSGSNAVNYALGGTVSVSDTSSPIYGAKVVIKPNTLGADSETIRISHEDAPPGEFNTQAQEFGATQASKTLVLQRDTQIDLELPAEVTLPYDKNVVGTNDVPLVMYWDENTGEYSAVALSALDRDTGTVTFRTAHFSKYIVIVLRNVADSLGLSQPPADTGFRPNADDFFVRNFGAYDSPGGSCLGMANYSTWYFDYQKSIKGVGLQALYKEGVPSAEEDDQNVRELISRAYIASSQYWAKEAMRSQFAQGEVFTGTYLIQTMLATGAPQVLLMSDEVPISSFGHAVTVYRYDAENLRFEIYDNNFPRETVYLPWNPVTGFGSYPKYGGSAQEFAFDAWHSSFSPSTFKTLYDGIESGWSSTKFAKIAINQPTPSASDDNLFLADSETNVVLAGVVPRIPGEANPDAARFAHIYLNGVNKAGVAPVDQEGNFTFTIGTLPNPDGTDVMLLISESDKSWTRGFRAFRQAKIRTTDQTDFILRTTVSGNGTVTSQPAGIDCGATCNVSFTDGTNVTLTATPDDGQLFSSWSGACTGSALTCSLSMTQARNVTATFLPASQAGWSSTTAISIGGAGNSRAGLDNDGNAIVVWQQADTDSFANHSIWASRYTPAAGWGAPVLLEENTADTKDLHLAMDASSGKAMVAWQQLTSPGAYDVWAKPFDPETGWGTTVAIDNTESTVGKITLGIDAGGNAVSVWSQLEAQYSGRISIYANRFASGSWGTAQLIETESELGRVDGDPSLYVAPNGNAIAVWTGSGGTSSKRGIWSNRYTSGAGWTSASLIVSRQETGAFSLSPPFIAGDASGNAILAFGQMDVEDGQITNTLYAKRYQGGWQTANSPIAPPFNNGSVLAHPFIKLNGEGSALVLWGHTNSMQLSASFGAAGGTWGTPTVIHSGARAVSSLPAMGIDNQNGAIVSWGQSNDQSTSDLWLTQHSTGSGWTPPTLQEETNEVASDPSIAMIERGNAVLSWTQYTAGDVGTQILVRRYTSGR